MRPRATKLLDDSRSETCEPVPDRGPELGSFATLAEVEAEHIYRVLAATASLGEAATVLGINASTRCPTQFR
jgi:hypothetical protein